MSVSRTTFISKNISISVNYCRLRNSNALGSRYVAKRVLLAEQEL
jgi:hypothetical protein